jgi:cobalt-zinc-cadmium efflux system protein
MSQAVNILLEGTPIGVDLAALENELRSIAGVTDVHDLHVWTITSGVDAMSGHLVIGSGVDEQVTLEAARRVLHEAGGIDHTTIQTETEATQRSEPKMPI